MDVGREAFSPKTLIENCLTFNDLQEDITFLSQAMNPDKIFDLPLALVKIQTAFQKSNSNAMKLKESLELVLERERELNDKYKRLKSEAR